MIIIEKIRNVLARWFRRQKADAAPSPDHIEPDIEPDVEMNVDQLAAAIRQISDAISKLSASLADFAKAVAEHFESIMIDLAKKARAKKQYRKFAAARYVHVPVHTDNGYKIRAPTARPRLPGTA